jgi:hypothetical protein
MIVGIMFTLLGFLTLAGNSSDHAGTSRSSYTQQNGIPDTATVLDVHNYGFRSVNNYAEVTVTLRVPVGGQRQSVVDIPTPVSYQAGQVISVLVDPADPGHAELPGKPFTTASTSEGLVPLTVVFFVIGAICIIGGLRAVVYSRRTSSRSVSSGS